MHNLLRKIRKIFNKHIFSNLMLFLVLLFCYGGATNKMLISVISFIVIWVYSFVLAHICDKAKELRLTDDNYDKPNYKNLD